ncbi:MAG: tail fiber protein [Candidatus Sulfotelmatobacter sp.]|jgi:microcystin-dependent protein
MSDQYLGEIRMVGFPFAPQGWATCSGQLMSISQNTALFSLLGTNFGGDGKSNFALPNFQAQAPVAFGNGAGLPPLMVGETGGEYTFTLNSSQMAAHNHGVNCIGGSGSANSPANAVWASAQGDRNAPKLYAPAATSVNMAAAAIANNGGTQAHNNLPPFLGILFVIALQGIYPPRG